MVMDAGRLFRHVTATHWRTRMRFPASTLDAIERAVAAAELSHAGQIRFAIETSLAPLQVINDLPARSRALEVFGLLRVWDTEHNNGVLIYVQLADRGVEIVADRGLDRRVSTAEWEGVCRLMEEHFRAGRFEAGSLAGVAAVGTLLERHYPADAESRSTRNELPDRPAML
jgi:uncharacterized membrane protein